ILVSFILMYHLGIPSNIMSLSGLAISIGILVDAAVVMVENATHELTRVYGHDKITGDTTEIVVRSCRLVGKPIFFAVIIMLVSFLPVFVLGGQEGKMFHPLAFTKTFAMVGVAVLAITFVPAMIPIFIRGRLKSEDDNWIVRSFINIYKPVLTWLMQVPAAGLWFMAFLFIIGLGLAGMFGEGASVVGYVVLGLLLLVGTAFFTRTWARGIALVLLIATAGWAWRLPKLGREFMPPLDEGSILDMPVTIPRVSIAQASDDIRVRDRLMNTFPEVDMVVGKVGRADTPTDPSGIDMVETVVNLRPREWWPKRAIKFEDALIEARREAKAIQDAGFIKPDIKADEIENLANNATMEAVSLFDRSMRELAKRRQVEHAPVLARNLVLAAIDDLVRLFGEKHILKRPPTKAELEQLTEPLVKEHGLLLVEVPRQEEMSRMLTSAAEKMAKLGIVEARPDLLLPASTPWNDLRSTVLTTLGADQPSVFRDFFSRLEKRLDDGWIERVKLLNWEMADRAPDAIAGQLLDALRSNAKASNLTAGSASDDDLHKLREKLSPELAKGLFLWHKNKADVIKEMDSELQVPGWGNIWTQPIINRVDMLATGVRTQIGVKVFGPHQEDTYEDVVTNGVKQKVVKEKGIQTVSNEIAAALRGIRGAVDVFPDQIVGRTYLEVEINREKAARYGVNVADISDAIEVAMGGKTITTTVEGRQRFPVRVRYARDFWQTEDALRNILVTGRRGASAPKPATPGAAMGGGMAPSSSGGMGGEQIIQVPISDVSDIRVVEGPSMIKSENGMLRSYVQLNVRDRDIVGFVEEAQRVVAQNIKLPQGFFIEWSGQFEHQVRAKRTLTIIFPLVILLIFVILYMTFNDWRDSLLIILAVPGALVGGVIFQSLFGFNFSVAVWVGYIACFGMATQTGIVMLVYLHEAINAKGGLAAIKSEAELTQAIITGAVHRLRPKLMTEGVAIVGLMPMLWASGVGSEVIKPMAAPVLGGLLVADEVIDLLLPVIFNWYQVRRWRKLHEDRGIPKSDLPQHLVRPSVHGV
ncbi:MAG: efflux RND transporter permease subunit, partial [Tepidisphaerales bacterium]